jgi:hypothetical protein
VMLALALVAAGCGSGEDSKENEIGPGGRGSTAPGASDFNQPFNDVEAYPVVVASEIVVGENRFQLGLLNDNDAPIGSNRIDLHVEFFDLERSATRPLAGEDMKFIPTAKGRGVYVGRVEFDQPGRWGAQVTIEGQGISETVRTSFNVTTKASTPTIGQKVPASDTPTLSDAKLSEITTDPNPLRSFYQTSIAEAIASSDPFVVVFATPEFCQTAVCGPTLDVVNRVARGFPRLTFIHVEIYRELDPAQPVVPAVTEWGLPTEPWVFVVDSTGRVAAKYEGSVSPSELHRDLQRL